MKGIKVKLRREENTAAKGKKEVVQLNNAKQILVDGREVEDVFTLRKGITKGRRGKLVAS